MKQLLKDLSGFAFLAILGFLFVLLCVEETADAINSPGQILLEEDFNDGMAQGFGNEVGTWKVIDGKYTATTGIFRFSSLCDFGQVDYNLEADFINAKDGGFVVRARDNNNGIALIIRPSHNDIYWTEICWAEGKGRGWGNRYEIRKLNHTPGENLHIRIEVRGSEFKAYVNEEVKTIFKSIEFTRPKIALYLYFQPNQYWDNVLIRSLTSNSI